MTANRRRIVVVGASAAGLRCASRLARIQPDWQVTVVEQQEIFSYAACGLPYVLAGDIGEVDALRRTGDGALRDGRYFSDVKGVEILNGWRAEGVDPSARTLRIRRNEDRKDVPWDELVLATGARPRRLPGQPDHSRVRSFHLIHDVAPLHGALARGGLASVIIVGAGLVGCELAEAFGALWGAEVTLIEAAGWPLPAILDRETGALVAHALEVNGIRLLLGRPVESIEAGDGAVGVRAGGSSFSGDMAIVCVGVEPDVELARKAGVALGPTGGVLVDEKLATSVAGIWAVGDCVEIEHAVTGRPAYVPLGSLANRQGRTLANVLGKREDRFPPVAGSVAVKVFDCNVAAVGLTEREAASFFRQVRSVCISAQDRPHYWPETKDIALKLVYESGSRRVLGLQVVGEGDVTKRVDAASQLIREQGTIDLLSHMEHAYAPPFAPAVDPLAVIAFAAQNMEDGVLAWSPEEPLEGIRVLDVRHPEERDARPAPAGQITSVPQEEIRRRLDGLNGETWLVVCERGTRSAETARYLQARGIPARYLGGGLRWLAKSGRSEPERPPS